MRRGQTLLGALARAGFARLSEVGEALEEAAALSGWTEADLVEALHSSASSATAIHDALAARRLQ
ncbi:hypothetical protein DZF97_05920 [Clavibacter nebraskensis]|uniref:HPt domain-containing protein n=1 Tax=Clavibacter nebraskensis TaxID=31963 RepID=A0A399Q7R3_9MICO|nr:hypothetical protein DZF97_05920 [Clavibacter nebraskensis]